MKSLEGQVWGVLCLNPPAYSVSGTAQDILALSLCVLKAMICPEISYLEGVATRIAEELGKSRQQKGCRRSFGWLARRRRPRKPRTFLTRRMERGRKPSPRGSAPHPGCLSVLGCPRQWPKRIGSWHSYCQHLFSLLLRQANSRCCNIKVCSLATLSLNWYLYKSVFLDCKKTSKWKKTQTKTCNSSS